MDQSATKTPSGADRLKYHSKKRCIAGLLDSCLEVTSTDELLIIHDESLKPYYKALTTAIISRDLSATYLYLPKAYQLHIAKKITTEPEVAWLPQIVGLALSSCNAILNLLDGDLATARVRREIIQRHRPHGSRLAHIPGLSDDVIRIGADSNFHQILYDCELVAWLLGNAQDATLLTYDSLGNTYTLTLALGGWSNEPMMSPGRVFPGSWGNFPPGETFCCPEPEGISGSICINGSVPRLVLSEGQEVVLHFDAGRLISWESMGESPALAFFEKQQAEAKTRGDLNWSTFAELGIGLNGAVQQLTGNSLFDEKALNTIHIAIGDNTTFGHNNKADIHADLVTWNPSLIIDGMEFIRHGKIDNAALHELRNAWRAASASIAPTEHIRIKDAEVQEWQGALMRRLCKAGRLGLVRMGDDALSEALLQLYLMLRGSRDITLGELMTHSPKIRSIDTDFLIDTLYHYNCIIHY